MASTLPDELKDRVCYYVQASFDKEDARETLLSLALTSRAFVACARRALYTDPFRYTSALSFDTAIPLLAALESGLGVYVRKLEALDSRASYLNRLAVANDPKRWYELGGQPEGWAWAWAMFKASPGVISLALPFTTFAQVSKLVKPLRDVKDTLRELSLGSTSGSTALATPIHLILELLAASSGLNLRALHLANFTFAHGAAGSGRTKISRIPADISDGISIVSTLDDLGTIASDLLPSSSLRLRSLKLTIQNLDAEDVDDLLKDYGQQLTSLELSLSSHAYWPAGRATYGRYHDGYGIKADAFTLLPAIKHLQISSCCTLSLARLTDLSHHSPNLQTLSFADSVWTCDPPASTVDAILPEAELSRILETWSDLRSVDLGAVPLRAGKKFELLEASAVRKGWELKCRTCAERCYNCGDYH